MTAQINTVVNSHVKSRKESLKLKSNQIGKHQYFRFAIRKHPHVVQVLAVLKVR